MNNEPFHIATFIEQMSDSPTSTDNNIIPTDRIYKSWKGNFELIETRRNDDDDKTS